MYAGNSVINNSGLQNKNNGKPKKKQKKKQFMKFALKRTYEFLSRFDFLFSRQEQQQQYKEQQQQFLLTHFSCVRCQNIGT